MKNKSIMIQGTASSVGKSILTTALCRVLTEDGYNVAPFKSQNMALNSYITEEGLEMGRAQVVQAEACGKKPDALLNPILLKPTTDKKCQVILNGRVYDNLSAMEYHRFKSELKGLVKNTFDKLASQNDIIVLEGAGSPAEINLRENDLVNMGMAEISNSPVILVGDIDRGGVFASIYGTIMLLDEEERKRVKGVVINKFRGDVDILKPGIEMLEGLINIPVLGVIPYTDIQLEDEDSLAERFNNKKHSKGEINVEVLYLPHVSNFTDFNVFETQKDVNLRYVMRGESIGKPDILIIPGSKNTIEDLIYLRNSGLQEQILKLHRSGKLIVGICGGYQILGKVIKDPHGTESSIESVNGLGLLDVETVFEREKTTTQIEGEVLPNSKGILNDINSNIIKGYEIHMGQTTLNQGAIPFSKISMRLKEKVDILDGAVNKEGNVFGTYIHGIFDNLEFTREVLNRIREDKGLDRIDTKIKSFHEFKEMEYQRLASLVRKSLNMDKIYGIIKGD